MASLDEQAMAAELIKVRVTEAGVCASDDDHQAAVTVSEWTVENEKQAIINEEIQLSKIRTYRDLLDHVIKSGVSWKTKLPKINNE